jgi:hypothetical protein
MVALMLIRIFCVPPLMVDRLVETRFGVCLLVCVRLSLRLRLCLVRAPSRWDLMLTE